MTLYSKRKEEKNVFLKRILPIALCLALLCSQALAGAYVAYPKALTFTQRTAEKEHVNGDSYIRRTYPKTALKSVNEEMAGVIDGLAEQNRFTLEGVTNNTMTSYMDVGSEITRTGTEVMSFLTVCRTVTEKQQTAVDFDARVYNMTTGARLTLNDLLTEDSWALLSDAVRQQLTAYFPGTEADPAALDALCSREALEQTPFTLTPAKLSLHYRADTLYPGKNTLMHADVFYSALRPTMNEYGQTQTDNSRHKFIALTFDDGPVRKSSMALLDQLRRYGATATFFVVGTMAENAADVICREQDAGHSVGSHNWEHEYLKSGDERIYEWREKLDDLLVGIMGRKATLMRAPGGQFDAFLEAKLGLPQIHWSQASGDSNKSLTASYISERVNYNTNPGTVVLMHDMNTLVATYAASVLETLEIKGYMVVTVEELCDHYGVTLEPDAVFMSCLPEARELTAQLEGK